MPATVFNAFVFQKWQHEVYPSREQTGVGGAGHELGFPACAEYGLCLSVERFGGGPPMIAGPFGQSSKSFCSARLRTRRKYNFLALKQML